MKHQKVSNYYDHDCLQNTLLLYMSLQLKLLKTVMFWLKFTLSFSKNVLDKT